MSCNEYGKSHVAAVNKPGTVNLNPYKNIKSIPLPGGFARKKFDSGSFAEYLRSCLLKENTIVYLYNGQPKYNQSAQFALLDISVGDEDLQQCADAVMRLRAEFLFEQKLFEQIIFFDNNKTIYQFTKPYDREHFNKYLKRVFGMCGSASLSKQLKSVPDFSSMMPGDVIIRGGFPGHAVIVMDVAVNREGEKIYLLAQSYMPAQDIHVLKNPSNPEISPWYSTHAAGKIRTPEYTFMKNELMRW
ncbi:MAG: DUF4846 domain-containing protein [Ferruginibacter sp.]